MPCADAGFTASKKSGVLLLGTLDKKGACETGDARKNCHFSQDPQRTILLIVTTPKKGNKQYLF